MSLNFQSKKAGFTLAELLVVLGIIGVIAALTVPNLITSVGSKKYSAGLAKVYSDLGQAIITAQDKQSSLSVGTGTTAAIHTATRTELGRAMRFNTTGTRAALWTHTVYQFKAPTTTYTFTWDANGQAARNASGGLMVFESFADCNQAGINACGRIIVDLNAAATPNMWGYDVHMFYITKKPGQDYKIKPAGTQGDTVNTTTCAAASSPACTAAVLKDPNIL